MRELKTREDVHALIAGLTLLGTGGGGRPEQGLDALLPHVESGRRLAWVDVGSLPDDAWVCSVFGMGSIAPSEPLTAVERRQLGYPAEWVVAKPMVRAVEELQAYVGRRIDAIVPFELGAGNPSSPMDAGGRLAAAGALDGWVLFRGRVARKEWESRDGYMLGTTTVEGEGRDAGHTLRVWFKNENHVTWLDERPWVHSPDLIMLLDAETGTPYTNTLLAEGARVGVVGARAEDKLRTPAALALLAPRHYGYDLDWIPIEHLMGGR